MVLFFLCMKDVNILCGSSVLLINFFPAIICLKMLLFHLCFSKPFHWVYICWHYLLKDIFVLETSIDWTELKGVASLSSHLHCFWQEVCCHANFPHLYVIFLITWPLFKIFILSTAFEQFGYDVSCFSLKLSCLEFVESLDLRIYSFHPFGKFLAIISSTIFPVSCLLRDSDYT